MSRFCTSRSIKHGFSAGALHGDMDQKSRMETLDKFRSGELKLLAASDVAARGLDIPDVSHVFNFDLPWQSDDYVHRIGRTGRAGKEGSSTSLVTIDELKSLKDIEKMLGEPVVWIGEGPSEEDYAEAGKKRRGRGGRGARPGRGGGRGAAPAQARSDAGKGRQGEGRQHGERRGGQPKGGERQSEQRAPRGEKQDQPRAARQPDAQPPRTPAAAPAANGQNGKGGQRHQPRPAADVEAPPAPHARTERSRQPEPRSSGFADNVPAFLRNPVKRPAKVAGE